MEEEIKCFQDELEKLYEEYQENFPGDQLTGDVFHYCKNKLKQLGIVNFRTLCKTTEENNKNRKIFSYFINDEVFKLEDDKELLYDIDFVQDDSLSQGNVELSKKLLSGWCIKIKERSQFDELLYENHNNNNNNNSNIHKLVVRGSNLFRNLNGIDKSVYSRMKLTLCSDDEGKSRSLEQKSIEERQQADQRAKDLKLGKTKYDSKEEEEQPQHQIEYNPVILNVVFGDETSFVANEKKVYFSNNENLVGEIHDLITENMRRLRKTFQNKLKAASFKEKVEYWSSLRQSDATSQLILCQLLDSCLGNQKKNKNKSSVSSNSVFEPAMEIKKQYETSYYGCSKEKIVSNLVTYQSSVSLSSGFVTGFGGFMTLPISIPVALLATWTISCRLCFAIAAVYGHDIFTPEVCNAVLYCLTGSSNKKKEKEKTNEDTTEDEEVMIKRRLFISLARKAINNNNDDDSFYQSNKADSQIMVFHQENQQQEEEEEEEEEALELSEINSDSFKGQYKTLYDLLQVSEKATDKEIRIAYRKLALKYHPDKVKEGNNDALIKERFQMLAAAYEILGDPQKRIAYDKKLQQGNWNWDTFFWQKGIDKAKDAFDNASKHLKQHQLSGYVASRAVTNICIHTAEVAGSQAAVRVSENAAIRAVSSSAIHFEVEASLKAGNRLAATATTSSASRMIPFVGAIICGAIDCATTASVGRYASRIFKESVQST